MALNQQRMVHDLIEAVKLKRQKKSNPYDTNGSATISTNRGNKLRRNAQYVQQSYLNSPNGVPLFKHEIEFASYKRNIISYNPPLIDDDGDIIEDEDELEDGEVSPMEDNIYEDIKLEDLLCPLTNASNLSTHPSLSHPYFEKGLLEMIRIAEETLHREQEILWKMKEYFTQFRGDATWAPVGEFHTGYDDLILGEAPQNGDLMPEGTSAQDDAEKEEALNGSADNLEISVEEPEVAQLATAAAASISSNNQATEAAQDAADPLQLIGRLNEPGDEAQLTTLLGTSGVLSWTGDPERLRPTNAVVPGEESKTAQTNGDTAASHSGEQPTMNGTIVDGEQTKADASMDTGQVKEDAEEVDDNDSQPQSHRMTTRAQANRSAFTSHSSSPTSSIPQIHPMFQFPMSSVPDPYFGLQPNEASATTACLLQYVSKQEEVVRGMRELYEGLLKGLAMRKNVMRWCKADGHVGEMSDGEDWYDREEWGLEQDLVKGREEEEDEAAAAPGKKTRGGRRAVKD